MKRTVISTAVGGAFALGLSANASAVALDITTADPTAADTVELRLSGATALDRGVLALSRRLCVPGTMGAYRRANRDQFIVFCETNSTLISGLPAGKTKLLLRKSGDGGSGGGVQPVADSTNVNFLDLAALQSNVTSCAVTTVAAVAPTAPDTIGLPAFTNFQCDSTSIFTLSPLVPVAGVSDVEPAIFGSSAEQIGKLTIRQGAVVIFGVPVTKGLRDALQAAQGLTVNDDSEAQMPSLSRQQIASIYNGGITNWNARFSDLNGVKLNNTVSNTVFISRRVESSGTQQSSQIFMTEQACKPGVALFRTATAANDMSQSTSAGPALCNATSGAPTVFAGSGSSDTANCLSNHNTRGRWAIGVMSLERVPVGPSQPTSGAEGWRFIKVDGQAPTMLNVAEGRYPFAMVTTLQFRNGTVGTAPDLAQQSVIDEISEGQQSSVVLRSVNNSFQHAFGTGALMGTFNPPGRVPTLPSAAPAGRLTATEVRDNPVVTWSKSPTAAGLNNCQMPQSVSEQGAHNVNP